MKKIIFTILISTLITANAFAKYVSNGFLVEEKTLDFSHTIRSNICKGSIGYPVLSNSNEELIIQINDEIHDFVELYAVCNQNPNSPFSVKFEIPESGTKEHFSIRWITEKNGKSWRIDVLTFNRDTGALLDVNDVFNMLSNNMMGEIIRISGGHLKKPCKWEQFVEKIEKRDIQFYIEKGQWFLIFNATPNHQTVVDVKIPEYFLKGGDHDRG